MLPLGWLPVLQRFNVDGRVLDQVGRLLEGSCADQTDLVETREQVVVKSPTVALSLSLFLSCLFFLVSLICLSRISCLSLESLSLSSVIRLLSCLSLSLSLSWPSSSDHMPLEQPPREMPYYT